jgi:S1-C subfamily serine protease
LHDPPRGLKALTFAKGGVTRGDSVVALGYPVGLQGPRPFNQSVTMVSTNGTVSVPDTPAEPGVDAPRYRSLVQHTAALNPGSSGGPLLNDRGEVVGINALTSSGATEGQFYAITVSRILPVLKRLREGDANEYVGWGLIPNSARDDYGLTDAFLRDVGIVPQHRGLFNLGSDPASPSARQFSGTGETVTTIQQRPVDTVEQTCAILRSQRDEAELSVGGVGPRGTPFASRTVKLPGG